MYELKIENKHGEQLQLTNNKNYTVTATGLSPVSSNIITSSVANYSGERYITSRQQKRNIVLTIYINQPIERNRIALYQYIKSDDWIRIYYKNNTRDVYIDGYVESFDLDHFAQSQTAQVSIICPQPNFIDMYGLESRMSHNVEMFSFPFYANTSEPIVFSRIDEESRLIINNSDDEIGFIYEITCMGEVRNPFIYHTESNTYLKINGTFHHDDTIIINTINGHKSVIKDYLGAQSNLINNLDNISKWIQLQSGYNHLIQSASSGADYMESTVYYTNEYEGV